MDRDEAVYRDQQYSATASGTRSTSVSTEAGTHPKWNPNGRELFYRNGDKMMVVDVRTSPDLALSDPWVLFEHRYSFGSAQTVANYDISPDGQRFLRVKDESASGTINIVVNWFEELRRGPTSRTHHGRDGLHRWTAGAGSRGRGRSASLSRPAPGGAGVSRRIGDGGRRGRSLRLGVA
jgi:hypothetical protein